MVGDTTLSETWKSQTAAPRHGRGAGVFVELDQHVGLAGNPERGGLLVPDDLEAQHPLVPGQRTGQIGDLKPDGADASGGGQSIARRGDSILQCGRHDEALCSRTSQHSEITWAGARVIEPTAGVRPLA